MPALPDPPRDASTLPVEGFVRRIVWGVLFVLGSGALLAAAAGDHGRADWVLMSAPLFLIGLLNFWLGFRRRKRGREIFARGREVPAQITEVVTVYRNGLVNGWITTFRLSEPLADVTFRLSLNPAGVTPVILVHERWVAVHAVYEQTRLFRWQRRPWA